MNFSKEQFKQYIKYFDYSFDECILHNYHSLNEINDISNINHSLTELNNFKKYYDEIEIFYTNNFSIFTTATYNEKLKYIIFVKIGELSDMSIIGSAYFIYDYIEDQIVKNLDKNISFSNYCISHEELNQMLRF